MNDNGRKLDRLYWLCGFVEVGYRAMALLDGMNHTSANLKGRLDKNATCGPCKTVIVYKQGPKKDDYSTTAVIYMHEAHP